MPTVLNVSGIRVMIHSDDHPPAHVHCVIGSTEAVVLLEPEVTERERWGMRDADVRRAVALVRANRGRLLRAWRTWHGR